MENGPKKIQPLAGEFFKCVFGDLESTDKCRGKFDEMVRTLYRMPESGLK